MIEGSDRPAVYFATNVHGSNSFRNCIPRCIYKELQTTIYEEVISIYKDIMKATI